MRNIARRNWAITSIMYQAYGDPSLSDWINREMHETLKSAGKLKKPCRHTRQTSLVACAIQWSNWSAVLGINAGQERPGIIRTKWFARRVASQHGVGAWHTCYSQLTFQEPAR